jgi:hypothetical protein
VEAGAGEGTATGEVEALLLQVDVPAVVAENIFEVQLVLERKERRIVEDVRQGE